MPPKRKFKKTIRRKYKKKRSSNIKIGSIIGSTLSAPFPPMLRTKLKTVMYLDATSGTSGPDGRAHGIFYKLNSILNVGPAQNYPLGTLGSYTANSPSGSYYLLGTDKLLGNSSGIYQKFMVIASSCTITVSTQATSNRALEIVLLPRSQEAGADIMVTSQLAEQPYAKTMILPPVLNNIPKKLYSRISVAKLGGLTSLGTTNSDYVGGSIAYGASVQDPPELYNWSFRAHNMDGSDNGYALVVKAEVMHDVIFFDRNIATTSAPS